MQADDTENRIRAALPRIKRGGIPGKSYAGLARELGVDPSVIAKIASGERKVHLKESTIICRYLGIPGPSEATSASVVSSVRVVAVMGYLANQVWREIGSEVVDDAPTIAAVLDPRYAHLDQYALRVDGPCDPIARAGDYAIFVSYADVRKHPQHGDIVHVRRRQGHLQEDTLRKVEVSPTGEASLAPLPASSMPRVPLGPDTTAKGLDVQGLCISIHRPLT